MLCCQDSVKINAIVFSNDTDDMHTQNFNTMEGHFKDWSKHSLSLLWKIQIIETFGISQYLYALMVIGFNDDHWITLQKHIAKFIWNRNYYTAPAPIQN